MALTLEESSFEFAKQAHEAVKDKRPFTGRPYIEHPVAVAVITKEVPHTPEMVATAYLHDVLENNQSITVDIISDKFGVAVSEMVSMLTNPYNHGDGLTKQALHAMNKRHLSKANANAKTVKLADIIHNLSESDNAPPKFAFAYAKDKMDMLSVLREGDSTLWNRAYDLANSIISKHETKESA